MTLIVTSALVASVVAGVYVLGVVQGRYVERAKARRRIVRIDWMLSEAIHRWSPWTMDVSEARAKLAAAHKERTP